MDPVTLKAWRKSERGRLIAARVATPIAVLDSWRARIDGYLERSFPGLAHCRLAFCWPIKGEYDAKVAENVNATEKQKTEMQRMQDQKHNAAVKEVTEVTERFNEQLRAYKAKSAEKKAG